VTWSREYYRIWGKMQFSANGLSSAMCAAAECSCSEQQRPDREVVNTTQSCEAFEGNADEHMCSIKAALDGCARAKNLHKPNDNWRNCINGIRMERFGPCEVEPASMRREVGGGGKISSSVVHPLRLCHLYLIFFSCNRRAANTTPQSARRTDALVCFEQLWKSHFNVPQVGNKQSGSCHASSALRSISATTAANFRWRVGSRFAASAVRCHRYRKNTRIETSFGKGSRDWTPV
jgi:hypothetical protein